MDVQIELNTRIIADDQKIWIMHPGRGKRFYTKFATERAIFLDLPYASFVLSDIDDKIILRQKIRMSDAWRRYAIEYHYDPSKTEPSKDYTTYSGIGGDRSLNAHTGNVDALFKQMKHGDLVLVPGGGGQYGTVLFGEISGAFDPLVTLSAKDDLDYPVQFRRVNWLPRNFRRRELSEGLSKSRTGNIKFDCIAFAA